MTKRQVVMFQNHQIPGTVLRGQVHGARWNLSNLSIKYDVGYMIGNVIPHRFYGTASVKESTQTKGRYGEE
jgi:thiamine pyrophosphokinase